MARYSAAVWRPVERYQPGGSVCREMAAYRRYCLHTAVSNGSLFNWFNQPGNAVAHFYVFAGGTVEQYVDTRFQSTANLDGNHDTISVETEDMGFPFPDWAGANVPAWTDEQVEALAELGAWVHETHGIPIVACPNSLSGSKGFAYHRQGIDPWRISGGEHWSKSAGKVCPGDRRVAQVLLVIARAQTSGEDMTQDEHDVLVEIRDRLRAWENVPNDVSDETGDKISMAARDQHNYRRIHETVLGVRLLLGRDVADVDEAALAAALAPLLAGVDTATLLAAIQGLPAETVAAIKAAL